MPVPTIEYRSNKVYIVDQTKLPGRFERIRVRDIRAMWWAIKRLKIRDAPAIGIAGAFGVVLGLQHKRFTTYAQLKKRVDRCVEYLATSRPTAVNLFWALRRMKACAEINRDLNVEVITRRLVGEARAILREDMAICRRMADHGTRLVRKGDAILTHCNAGGLATADYGTALGVLFRSNELGKAIHVYVDETRPLLQGARLTVWELKRAGIGVTLICDNMAASLMAGKRIDKIFVGADRLAANGDTANKIGTYNLAVLAKYHNVPFYVVAPSSTFDTAIKSGKGIPIEQRGASEVTSIQGRRIAPDGIDVYNPAFDVTPSKLITAIVTEKGVLRPPYAAGSVKSLMKTTEARK